MKIPKILHRTVPLRTTPQVERWWKGWAKLHPGWQHLTWRDPITNVGWETGHLWKHCCGAQMAGMIRLELLWQYGGIYLDSDIEPVRNMDDLRGTYAFACREDHNCVPDFVLGAPPGHPAIRECIDRVLQIPVDQLIRPEGPWISGPGVTTHVFTHRTDVSVLLPVTFAPIHWSRKHQLAGHKPHPATYGIHHWAGSWPGASTHVEENP